jgi:hypothetical protein
MLVRFCQFYVAVTEIVCAQEQSAKVFLDESQISGQPFDEAPSPKLTTKRLYHFLPRLAHTGPSLDRLTDSSWLSRSSLQTWDFSGEHIEPTLLPFFAGIESTEEDS